MKKSSIIVFTFIITLSSYAQNKSKQEVLELMANDTCECITKKKLKSSDSTNEKQMALGLCLITSFNGHKSKSKYFAKKTLKDIEKIGEEVGMVMGTMCPEEFLSIFSSEEIIEFVEGDDDSEKDNSITDEALSIEVELVDISNDAISYITVKDDFNKTHQFLIMDEFEGSEFLKKSNFHKVFKIGYKEVELFDLSEKQYISKKVIIKIEAI